MMSLEEARDFAEVLLRLCIARYSTRSDILECRAECLKKINIYGDNVEHVCDGSETDKIVFKFLGLVWADVGGEPFGVKDVILSMKQEVKEPEIVEIYAGE